MNNCRTKLFLILLFLFGCFPFVFAAHIDTLYVASESMNIEIASIIILPENYFSNDLEYSVVYLLHGAGGDFGNWLHRVPEIQNLSDEYGVIIVCPDGDKTSWYIDSPVDPSMKYETYISFELVPTVDSIYSTIALPNHRAITGLSMGGHGALFLAFKHPEIWGTAGSMSGCTDLRPFSGNWDLDLRLGSQDVHPENWKTNSVIDIARATETKQKFIIDCGEDDFFLEVNRNLHRVLMENNIQHQYSERPGAHNWDYWRESIVEHLEFFAREFNQ